MSTDEKLDKIADSINQINVTLALQHQSLDIHIKRTELLEKRVDPLEKGHVQLMGVMKILGMIGTLIVVITSIIVAYKTH